MITPEIASSRGIELAGIGACDDRQISNITAHGNLVLAALASALERRCDNLGALVDCVSRHCFGGRGLFMGTVGRAVWRA